MVRIYADAIWKGNKDYNNTAKAYLNIKEQVTAQMREDVANGRKVSGVECTAELFTEITGLPYEVEE